MSHQQDSEIYDIGIEFQPQLRRILLPSISNVTTVDGLLDKFSETAGTVKTSIKQAIPYRPCFYTGDFVPKPAPSPHMPLTEIFTREGGLFVVDLEDESIKMLTPSHLKPKKKKKKKRRAATGNENSDDESAVNPGIDHGSATSALEDDVVSTSDFDEIMLPNIQVNDTLLTDHVQFIIAEMHNSMRKELEEMRMEMEMEMEKERTDREKEKEKERTDREKEKEKERIDREKEKEKERIDREKEKEKERTDRAKETNRLQKEMEKERTDRAKETNRLQKEMEKERTDRAKEMEKERTYRAKETNRLQKEIEKERAEKEKETNKLRKEMEKERTDRVEKEKEMAEKTSKLEKEMVEKTSELEKEIEVERKKRSLLEVDVDDLKLSTNDIADWIVAGCIPKGGGKPLRHIQIRNLLDRVQSKLAWHSGLTLGRYSRNGSVIWREALDGLKVSQRLATARNLLNSHTIGDVHEKAALIAFMSSDNAMRLAVEGRSKFRRYGDDIAHHDLNKPQFDIIIDEHHKMGGRCGHELKAFVQFLFP